MILTSHPQFYLCILLFQAKPILEWFSNVAASAVIDMKFDPVTRNFVSLTDKVYTVKPVLSGH